MRSARSSGGESDRDHPTPKGDPNVRHQGRQTTYIYESYGKTTVSGTSSASFFGFTGRENDSTGTLSLYNYRARYYSPPFGRFMSEDPLWFAVRDANLYRYVNNNPLSLIDPLGLDRGCGISCFLDVVGLGASVVSVVGLLAGAPWLWFVAGAIAVGATIGSAIGACGSGSRSCGAAIVLAVVSTGLFFATGGMLKAVTAGNQLAGIGATLWSLYSTEVSVQALFMDLRVL